MVKEGRGCQIIQIDVATHADFMFGNKSAAIYWHWLSLLLKCKETPYIGIPLQLYAHDG